MSQERRIRFSIGIDTKGNRLVLDGSSAEVAGVRRLIAKLDIESNDKDRSVRLVASNRDVRDVAQALRPAVKQLAQSGREAASNELELEADEMPAKGSAKKGTAKSKAVPKPGASKGVGKTEPSEAQPSRPDPLREREGGMTKPGGKPDVPVIIGGLKGDVNVEALDDLGVLILRGNEQDVEAVMNIIRQIEKLSAGTTPDIHLRLLEHVDSESLAELLTSVYERLNRSRGRSAQDMTQQVTIIAVGKPNAVLILASQNDIEAVNELIDKLDQPVDPSSEFEVFRLRYAIASQVLTAIDSFFSGGTTGGGQGQTQGATSRAAGGLRGRVRTISDSRTNSVIVQARPRDLAEVRRLIDELDQVGSQAVNQIKLIPLKNALAEEMAELLNLAIQSTISPPPQARAGQAGGAGGGGLGGLLGGAQGQVDQKLREAKSAVLQLLESDDNGEQLIESGILADIRINADARTNSLVVTAPEESLELIQALVRRFDKPSAMVAEIKHFTLKNADASSISKMLTELFTQQQQGQRQTAGQQAQQLGLQLAGAEDASSQLIPLKFSTDIRTNSIIAVGGAEALSVVEAVILRLDASDVRQRQSSV
ncbi:MAG TPA: secretin N-terminal domain-containing protein, partial [Planctomycetaceae bacterium]|nr:secretin N-terminal domain-containing protein [Planctomycetaceae bacterium]